MIYISINDSEFHKCNSDKEADKIIKQKVKEYLSHPYFMNLEKIKDLDAKCWLCSMNDNNVLLTRYCNQQMKLQKERDEFLTQNNIAEPDCLKIKITH